MRWHHTKNPEHGTYAAHYIFLEGLLFTTSPNENVREITHEMLAQRDKILTRFREAAEKDPDSVYAASFMVVGDRITVYRSHAKYRTLKFPATKRGYNNALMLFAHLVLGLVWRLGKNIAH